MRKITQLLSMLLCFVLFFQQSGLAQTAAQLDLSGYITGLKTTFIQDKYRPLHLRYLGYDAKSDNFKLLLDKGDFVGVGLSARPFNRQAQGHNNGTAQRPSPTDNDINQETNKLMQYFFIGLSLPNETFWVNLRPDSPDNVIDNYLARTDVGRIMLETDLQLKKDTARWTSPETPQGRKYWDKLYKKAEELFGNENITIPTLTRPWIVPGEIIVRETVGYAPSAYIYKATLKVMLEEDYLRNSHQLPVASNQNIVGAGLASAHNAYEFKDPRLKELNKYSTQLIHELIIPELTKEINSSKRYAELRQMYYSLILAQWFKARFGPQRTKKTVGTGRDLSDNFYKDIINSGNLTGLTSKQSWDKQTYFDEYQKSFKQGEYSIQEPVFTPTGQVIRSYFSGGESLVKMAASSSGVIENGIASIQSIGLPVVNSFTRDNLIGMNCDGYKIVPSAVKKQNYYETF